jgi:hypothetical protein
VSYVRKTLEQLVKLEEPAWPLVETWVREAIWPVEVLPPSDGAGAALVSMQVTTRSPMGAVILHSGGLLVDHGWIRILGSGHSRLPRSLPDWNFACGLPESQTPPAWLLVADDVVGGFFALDGGRFGGSEPTVWYFPPDSLEWEDMGLSYSGFLRWCLSGKVDKFYEAWRWPGWEHEVARVGGGEMLSIYPPLSAEGVGVAHRSRRAVPVMEIFRLHVGAV